jgi:maspardin
MPNAISLEFLLKRLVLGNFPTGMQEEEIANSLDFMVEQLETLTQRELSSRLTLNCLPSTMDPQKLALSQEHITLMDSLDYVSMPERLREEVYKFYPDARIMHLRTGGNFPFLSRADEFNLYITVHLRSFGIGLTEQQQQLMKGEQISSGKEEVELDTNSATVVQ